MEFDAFCDRIATKEGGFTLWVGAGAAHALKRRVPLWGQLVEELVDEAFWEESVEERIEEKLALSDRDIPGRLEAISSRIGHAKFRRFLFEKLFVPFLDLSDVDIEVALAQAAVGTRAATIVSFNVEPMSALPFCMLSGGMVVRTFARRDPFRAGMRFPTEPGQVGRPVYFPHGLLHAGELVMTESEYAKHRGSLAVATAVHLAIGSDLVVLGMSLEDAYLRAAILDNREWLHRIYWLGPACPAPEWFRVADVTHVRIGFADLWSGLLQKILTRAPDLEQVFNESLPLGIPWAMQALAERSQVMREAVKKAWLKNAENASAEHRDFYVRLLANLGISAD